MKVVMLTLVALTLLTVVSANDVAAQGRGRGRGHDNWGLGKKCDKFVNCHDARDGRWDNRGPNRRAVLRSRYYSPYARTRVYGNTRSRRYYDERAYLRNRRRW